MNTKRIKSDDYLNSLNFDLEFLFLGFYLVLYILDLML